MNLVNSREYQQDSLPGRYSRSGLCLDFSTAIGLTRLTCRCMMGGGDLICNTTCTKAHETASYLGYWAECSAPFPLDSLTSCDCSLFDEQAVLLDM